MAKKTTATRVFQLARQLGVSSKDVIEKCKSEEIPGITNHMSAVSLGLAATIREWFSESEGNVATAVETAPRVDVATAREKVKKKAARKKKVTPATEQDKPVEIGDGAATAVADVPEAPAAPPPTPAAPVAVEDTIDTPEVSFEPRLAEPPAPHETPDAPAEPEETPDETRLREVAQTPDATDTPLDGETPDASKEVLAEEKLDWPVMNVPVRPAVIAPAGPRLEQPTKTKLAGPKVIRVEAPDTLPSPQPRRVARGNDGPTMRGGTRTGRGVGGPPDDTVVGSTPRGGEPRTSRRNKRRSASAGRESGRTARAPQGPAKQFNWREQDLLERERRLSRSAGFLKAARRDNLKRSASGGHRVLSAAQTGGSVRVEEPVTIKSLSAATGAKVNDIIRQLVSAGHTLVAPASVLDAETAAEVMLHYDIVLEVVEQKTAEQQIVEQFSDRKVVDERPRSPVVTILGHVDHGKTTLLDSIRNANVAQGEAGGITQATSAFRVSVKIADASRTITFIDTPGHEAFTEMRARGAKVTDIVVLVVAADDGVMPQTIESINHAKAAEVPIVIALNKIDKAEATETNIQRIYGQLAEHELNPVEWGGQTEVIKISALNGEGVPELLEVLDYQAQLLELTADYGGSAVGTVIESQLEEGRGPVARLLVGQGTLNKGDYVVVGRAYGRVRDIVDDHGKRIKEAGPSTPVAISGISKVPDAGDKFYVVASQREAEAAADERMQHERERDLAQEKITLDNIFEKLSEAGRKELPLVVKTDVQGSLETLIASLSKIGSEEVSITLKHSGVGGVNESDVALAEACSAIVIAFNVTAPTGARKAAEARGVDVRFYDVIYDLMDDVKKAAEGLLDPELKLEILGHAEVREVFKVSKVGAIAGCYVTDGNIERHAQIRVTRDDIVVEKDRRLEQLKRFKDDVKTVNSGQECGMRIEGYDDIKAGDVIECYKTLEVRRTL